MKVGKKLLLIFLLALSLRLIFLGSVPGGFHNDEVDVGYVGKFLILSGRDPTGAVLPLAFNKFGDFRPTGLFYLAGVSQLIFGSNEFAVRLPTALFGALTVFPVFFLAREIFADFSLRDSRSVRHRKKPFDQSIDDIRSDSVDLTYASARQRLKRKSNFWSGLASSYFLRWLPSLSRLDRSGTSNQVPASSYLAAFFLAILPWHIVLSRAGHEAIVGYFLITWGLYFICRFKAKNQRKFLVYSFLFLVLSYFFYHGTRTVVPLVLLSFLVFWRSRAFCKFALFFVVLTAVIVLAPMGKGRLSQVVFYKDPGTVAKLRELPYADQGNILAARVFHNKVVVYSRGLVGHYLQYFSPDFLFLRGGYPERYMVPESGLLLILSIFPLVAGLVTLAGRGGMGLAPVIWLLVAPIQAVLTYDDIPNITRSSFMVIPVVLIAGFGAAKLWGFLRNNFTRKVVVGIWFWLLLAELIYFSHQYLFHQKLYKGILRDDGTREIARYISQEKGNYDLVVAQYGGNLPFYWLFYSNIFDGEIRVDVADRKADFSYGNVLFTRDGCPSHRADHYLDRNVLYIDEANCEVKPDRKEVGKVIRGDETVAYRAYVVNVNSK